MSRLRIMQPENDHEKVFCNIVEIYKGIGYGRMIQMITGIWAKMLMSSGLSERAALLGALDLETWLKKKK